MQTHDQGVQITFYKSGQISLLCTLGQCDKETFSLGLDQEYMYSKNNNNNNNSKPNQPGFPTVCHDLFAPQEFLSTNLFFFFFQHGITPKAQPPGFMGFLETNTEQCLKMPKSQMYGRQKDRFILLDDNGADIYPGASVTPNQILASTILYQLCNQLPSQEQSIPVVAALSTGAIN